MRFSIVQLFLIALSVSVTIASETKAQEILSQTISLKIEEQPLKNAIKTIERVSNVHFTYRKGLPNLDKKVNIEAQNEKFSSVLNRLFDNTGIQYEVIGKQILLSEDPHKYTPPSVSEPPKIILETPFVIEGTITNTLGEPLIGASVVIKGTTKGTVVDNDGKYKFTVTTDDKRKTLVVSYVGYKAVEEPIRGRNVINFVLQEGEDLQELVVVGYGSAKKSDLTGSLSTIKPKQADAIQFNSVDGLMRGRAAGVQVIQAGGDPGGAISVKIRGVNSLRGDNEPLYVVDGVIMSNITADNNDPFAAKSANSGQGRQSGLTGINPQDIASIEILKDASATAIYGSRGANGVVLITTKSGKGRPTATYTSNFEMAQASKHLNVLDAVGYAKYINEVEAINGRVPRYGLDTLQNVDWQDALQRNAINSNNRLTVSGSSRDDKTKYYFATGFLQNKGIVKNSALEQGDLKINFSQEFSRKLTFNLTVSGVANKNLMSMSTEPIGNGENSIIMKMLVGSPIRNAIPDLEDLSTPYDNPMSWLLDYDDISNEKRILSGMNLTYKINKSLSYKVTVAGDYRNKERKRWFGKSTFNGKVANGSLGLSQFERSFYQVENLLIFDKKIGKTHKLNGTVGVTYDNENIKRSSVINENFFTDVLRTEGFGFGQLLYPYIRDRTCVEVFSGLARVNYNIKEKYLLTVSGRADGSSKFAKGDKFSFFPAASLAWRVSEESFLKKVKFIESLKWRIGYGRSGNQAIAPYGTFARYGQVMYVNGNTLQTGAVPINIQNNDLKWETTDQFNTGIDFSIFKEKLSGSVDAYYKKTDDLLQVFTLPTSAGFSSILNCHDFFIYNLLIFIIL